MCMQGGKFQQSRHTLYDRQGTRVAHDTTAAQVSRNKGDRLRTKMISPCSLSQHGGDEASGAPTHPDPHEVWAGTTAIASMSGRYCVFNTVPTCHIVPVSHTHTVATPTTLYDKTVHG